MIPKESKKTIDKLTAHNRWKDGGFSLKDLKKAAEQIREATKHVEPTRITVREMASLMVLMMILMIQAITSKMVVAVPIFRDAQICMQKTTMVQSTTWRFQVQVPLIHTA